MPVGRDSLNKYAIKKRVRYLSLVLIRSNRHTIFLYKRIGKRLRNSFKRILGRLSNSLINSRKKETLNRGRLIERLLGRRRQ